MSARFTVYLREAHDGWEWSRLRTSGAWNGAYRTQGMAKGAAKRSITPTVGKKTNPADFEFIVLDKPTDAS